MFNRERIMSRTLFWYLFKDLVRIFILASICLAGIMSFGGLLQPLTKQGLEGSQLGEVLLFFIPAMLTYSVPVAAIFATTIVYGRLSADNELTACRAAGISYLSIATPAIVLGLLTSIGGILFLCFVVPSFSLRVEQVIYSNIARIVAKQIEQRHQIRFAGAGTTIFALKATAAPQKEGDRQLVILERPMIVTYEKETAADRGLRIPKEFWMARQADVYITQKRDTDQIMLEATLVDGTRFPRKFAGATQGTVAATAFGPYLADAPTHEDPKFLGILELRNRLVHPEKNQLIRRQLQGFVQADQAHEYLALLAKELGGRRAQVRLENPGHPADVYLIQRDGPITWHEEGNELLIKSAPGHRYLRIIHDDDSGGRLDVEAGALHLRAIADNEAQRIEVMLHGFDAADMTAIPTPRPDFDRRAAAAMPAAVGALARRPVDYYLHSPTVNALARKNFGEDLMRLRNSIRAEMNSRASFAVSCLILVIVGCALGMMFRSGNFLTAFALSVIPAILTIALIVTGQQVSKNTQLHAALSMGLGLIWVGNALVAVLAAILVGRLQKT